MKGIENYIKFNNRNIFPHFLFFILSPFLSIPILLNDIYKKRKAGIYLTILLVGIISYLYIPYITNDRVRYYELYDYFNRFSWSSFSKTILSNGTDLFFPILIYLSSKVGFSLQLLFALLNMFTVGVWLYIFYDSLERIKFRKVSGGIVLLCFIIVMLSFNYANLYSGIRYYFASSLILLAFYRGLVLKRKRSLAFLVIAIIIHFSMFLFLVPYIIIKYFRKNNKLYRRLFLYSFLLIAIPQSVLLSFFEALAQGTQYAGKIAMYLGEQDMLEASWQSSSSAFFAYITSMLWVFFAYMYLIITKKRQSNFRNIIYLSFALINIFFQTPTIFVRYSYLVQAIFAFMIIEEAIKYKNNKILISVSILFLMNMITQIIILRDIISASYFNWDNLLLISIIFKPAIGFKDFLLPNL